MAIELRPAWCLTDEVVAKSLELSPWVTEAGREASSLDGDEWRPGETIRLRRSVKLNFGSIELKNNFDIRSDAVLGIAARWACRSTSTAGTHLGGPQPRLLTDDGDLVLEIPTEVGGEVEVETCLVVNWRNAERAPGSSPDGALIWSDSWSVGKADRTILLEGAEARLPVSSDVFSERYGSASSALWSVEIEGDVEPDDRLSNAARVVINREMLDRDFKNSEGLGDSALLPATAIAGMQVDLVRALTGALIDRLDELDDWADVTDGSVGAMLAVRLAEAFGSLDSAKSNYETDQATFSRALLHRFAPESWRGPK